MRFYLDKKRGFTLIELVIVVSILAIIMTVPILSFKTIESFKAKNQVRKLVMDINQAKNFASVNKIKTEIRLREDGYSINLGEGKIEDNKFVEGLCIYEKNLSAIIFNERGRPSLALKEEKENTSGTIKLKFRNKLYDITVTPVVGEVNLFEK